LNHQNVSFNDDYELELELAANPSEMFVSRLTPRPPSLPADGLGSHSTAKSGFVLGDVDDDADDDDNDASKCHFDSEEVECYFKRCSE
jgi:hypothetical protein